MNTSGWTQEQSPFHAGEHAIQTRLGVREQMENFGRRVIRDYLPEQHREFYRNLPFLVLGSVDDEGRPWASLVAGNPGFIDSPTPTSLRVGTAPLAGSPLAEHAAADLPVGILGMLPDARRRNRATGHISTVGDGHFDIAINQTFGNCPQYIQARSVSNAGTESAAGALAMDEGTVLDRDAQSLIAQSDTFFIASTAGNGVDGASAGADASHRGGKAGFVRVDGNRLTFPDFSGNNHFNTLGNIELTGKAGMLFVDFESGDLLYLTGDAVILWDDPAIHDFEGAQRFIAVDVTHWRRVAGSLPITFRFLNESPSFENLGTWEGVERKAAERQRQSEYRPLRIVDIVQESTDVRSLYLQPVDNIGRAEQTEPFLAGQYLPVRLLDTDQGEPLDRFYSLSNSTRDQRYRLSVKRDGVASTLIHTELAVGEHILAKAPAGNFVLEGDSDRPVVLLSAGIGITPVLAMARELVESAENGEHERPIYFIHGARSGAQHAFRDEVMELRQRYPHLHVHFAYSRPEDSDRAQGHFHSEGRVDLPLLKNLLPLDDYEYYLCGPGAFTADLHSDLLSLRIPAERVHYEAFGPATVAVKPPLEQHEDNAEPIAVTFEQSQKEALWSPAKGSLLELAESVEIDAPFACRSGSCGSCAVARTQGEISYRNPTVATNDDEVLLCSAVPARGEDRLVLQL